MKHLLGIYKHLKSNKKYEVIALGRDVTKPNEQVVIYRQLYESTLRGTNIKLPYGSVWTRPYDAFFNTNEIKFKKVTK